MSPFTFQDIPEQAGRAAIVTGANTGIGYEAAKALAQARVILACRNQEIGSNAVERIRAEAPAGAAEAALLDLSDLASVTRFADEFIAAHQSLDLLVNNAGVMAPPLSRTKQNHELQFGTNHLGHFALTAQLMPLLKKTPGAHRRRVELRAEHRQDRPRRSRLGEAAVRSVAGVRPEQTGQHDVCARVAASAHRGRLKGSGLRRASGFTATDLEISGYPAPAKISKTAQDQTVARRLFDESERLTGVSFALPAPAAKAVR